MVSPILLDLENYNANNIRIKKFTNKTTGLNYTILNYDPTNLLFDKVEGLYRSVILSDPEGELLCFSHPRSEVFQTFQQKYPLLQPSEFFINEIIEGTMIQLFWDSRNNSWEIATKGAVGCEYWFYRTKYPESIKGLSDGSYPITRQKTFRDMFFDIFESVDSFSDFPKDHCYQFIIQHPENHIVLNLKEPAAYLVGVYQMSGNIQSEIQVRPILPTEYEQWDLFKTKPIQFPNRFTETSYEELIEKYFSIHSDYKMVGCMILHLESGERASIENPVYKEIRELRGNHPNLQYQYLCLRRINKVHDFLRYFPQYKKIFYRFYKQYCDFLSGIHQSYLTYYIQKKGIKISKKYFPLIYRLHHEVYLPSLQNGEKIIMRLSEIAKYIENVEPSELIYYLNYHLEENIEERKIVVREPELRELEQIVV